MLPTPGLLTLQSYSRSDFRRLTTAQLRPYLISLGIEQVGSKQNLLFQIEKCLQQSNSPHTTCPHLCYECTGESDTFQDTVGITFTLQSVWATAVVSGGLQQQDLVEIGKATKLSKYVQHVSVQKRC